VSSPGPAGPYPGNPSLPAEVREKILSTFRHALNLFKGGNTNDCLIGCEFILKMDPRFAPARQLQEKARNPYSEVDIADLEAAASLGAPAGPSPAKPGAPSSTEPPPSAPAAAPPAEMPDPQRLLAEAAKQYEGLDFEGAIAAATRALALLPGNAEALALIEKAAGRKATEPLIESTRARAEQDLTEGRLTEARLGVERMRAIDPDAPAIAALEHRLSAAPSPAGAPASMPDFSLDPQGPDPFAPGSSEGGIFTGPSEATELDSFSSRPSRPTDPPASRPARPGVPAAEADIPPPASSDLFLPAAEEPSIPMMPNLSSAPSPAETEEAMVSKREIGALLKQGDEAARKGERQQAIEVWSRVFLIDINNAEAVTRIERARQEMADQGRLVADYLKKGRESFEAGDHEGARKLFLQAQESDPNEPTARLYLERIERAKGEKAEAAEPQGAAKSAVKIAASAKTEDDFSEEPATFPPIALPSPASRRAGLAGLKVNPRVLGLIGAFLALTLVGVYFVFKGPKSRDVPAPKDSSAASVQHARDLLGNGKIDEARSELRRIGPGDPDSEEARKLLAELGRPAAADSPGGKSAPPPPPPAGAVRESRADSDLARLRDTAEKAFAEKRYIEALKNFNLAAPGFRNDPSFSRELGLASDKVTALTPAVKFYNEGEYETAIPILWRIVQEDRENRDARSYLLRCYYNQGISQLQNGLYPKAAQAFQEALALDSNDAEALRHKKFAERYQKGDLDLMGRIYVRHLNHRP
jgi:tetratricopeptide (TPR) repeat protein